MLICYWRISKRTPPPNPGLYADQVTNEDLQNLNMSSSHPKLFPDQQWASLTQPDQSVSMSEFHFYNFVWDAAGQAGRQCECAVGQVKGDSWKSNFQGCCLGPDCMSLLWWDFWEVSLSETHLIQCHFIYWLPWLILQPPAPPSWVPNSAHWLYDQNWDFNQTHDSSFLYIQAPPHLCWEVDSSLGLGE